VPAGKLSHLRRVALVAAEVEDSEDHEHQDRQHDRELHDRLAALIAQSDMRSACVAQGWRACGHCIEAKGVGRRRNPHVPGIVVRSAGVDRENL
jgi:hypothetical protein